MYVTVCVCNVAAHMCIIHNNIVLYVEHVHALLYVCVYAHTCAVYRIAGLFRSAKLSCFCGNPDFVCFIFIQHMRFTAKTCPLLNFVHLIFIFEAWRTKKMKVWPDKTNLLYSMYVVIFVADYTSILLFLGCPLYVDVDILYFHFHFWLW